MLALTICHSFFNSENSLKLLFYGRFVFPSKNFEIENLSFCRQ